MLKAYKYRIYPTKDQESKLAQEFGNARYIYNWGLARKIESYQKEKKNISCFELMRDVTNLKKEVNWLLLSHAQVLQQSLRQLDNAFTAFFKKKNRFPKFKNKYGRQSITYPQGVKIDLNTIYLPKLGLFCKPEKRNFEGKVKSVTVSMTPTRKYFASVLVDNGLPLPEKEKITEAGTVGVDVGLTHFLTISTGEKVENPRHLKNSLARLKVKQRQLSRKKKGSNGRKKAKLEVAKVHEKVTNKRSDFAHKLSQRLVSENQAVAIEDLNVSGMLKNHCLAQAISDVSWSHFFGYLSYKAEWYGKTILKIGRFDASSKICSCCGNRNQNLSLKDREWTCEVCHTTHDRDLNASLNIKNFALLGLQGGEPSLNKIA